MSYQGFRRLLATAVSAASIVLIVGGPVAARVTDTPALAPAADVAKPVPVPPADAYRPSVGPRLVPKPHRAQGALATPQTTWSLSLTASPSTLWPTQYTTLTATANQDVGPTPYYISIYENSSGNPLVVCGAGTTCSVSVTKPTPMWMPYEALISTSPGVYPPPGEVAWANIAVTWTGVGLNFSAAAPTLPVTSPTTVTATATQDIGPSPFYIEIFDTTTSTVLARCGSGISCSATVSQVFSTTHRYLAAVASYSTGIPPANIQTLSPPAWVTWASTGWRVSLTANPDGTVTATTNQDVGPSPYYIEIFTDSGDTTASGTRLTSCAFGRTCTLTYPPAGSYLVAFVSVIDTSLPPSSTQASSPVIFSPTLIP